MHIEAHVFFNPLQLCKSELQSKCKASCHFHVTSAAPALRGQWTVVPLAKCKIMMLVPWGQSSGLWAHCRCHLLSVKLWTVNVGQWAHCQGHSHQGSSSGAVSSHSAQSSRMKEATTQRFSVRMLKSPASSTCTPTRPLIFTRRVTRP